MRFHGHVGGLLSQIAGVAGRLWHGSGRGEHPTRNFTRRSLAVGVLGYREAARRKFTCSVALSTQSSANSVTIP